MGLTTTDLLRGWSVSQGVVPFFGLRGARGRAGAVIAAAIPFGVAVGRLGEPARTGRRS